MGSYKWGCKARKVGLKYSYPTYNLTYYNYPVTTHEPPSRVPGSALVRVLGFMSLRFTAVDSCFR